MSRWREKIKWLKRLSLLQIVKLLLRKIAQGSAELWDWFSALTNRHRSMKPEYTARALGMSRERFREFALEKPGNWSEFYIQKSDLGRIVSTITEWHPAWKEAAIAEADGICKHQIPVLGDIIELGEQIDWHKDYVSGHRWPQGYYKALKKVNLYDDSDIKYVWELSRFHHAVSLGRAYVLTSDEKYAIEFVHQFKNWVRCNTPYWGVNWTCTMECAIRVVNLIWALFLFQGSAYLDAETRMLLISSIYVHGEFISRNLEFNTQFVGGSYERLNGNHYVADIVGLLHIAVLFPEFKKCRSWSSLSLRELLTEIELQVESDGSHWEHSVNYHGLVAEMVILSCVLLRKNGLEFPSSILTKISGMIEFAINCRKPNGEIPLARDSDNGRMLILGGRRIGSVDYVIAEGLRFLDGGCSDRVLQSEDELWLFGKEWREANSITRRTAVQIASKGFEQSGFYVLRKSSLYMFAICSPVGMKGYSGHTHNDFLSVELFAFGKTFLTDCGTYVYSRYPIWRNRFRSIYSHNTVVVDGCEPNRFSDRDLFTIETCSAPRVSRWESTEECDLLDAEYRYIGSTGITITHRRVIRFDKSNDYWVVKDTVEGEGQHTVETLFHFDVGIDLAVAEGGCIRTICHEGANLSLIPMRECQTVPTLRQGWVSRRYGTKERAHIAHFNYVGQLPFEQEYALIPVEHDNSSTASDTRRSMGDFAIAREKVARA